MIHHLYIFAHTDKVVQISEHGYEVKRECEHKIDIGYFISIEKLKEAEEWTDKYVVPELKKWYKEVVVCEEWLYTDIIYDTDINEELMLLEMNMEE